MLSVLGLMFNGPTYHEGSVCLLLLYRVSLISGTVIATQVDFILIGS